MNLYIPLMMEAHRLVSKILRTGTYYTDVYTTYQVYIRCTDYSLSEFLEVLMLGRRQKWQRVQRRVYVGCRGIMELSEKIEIRVELNSYFGIWNLELPDTRRWTRHFSFLQGKISNFLKWLSEYLVPGTYESYQIYISGFGIWNSPIPDADPAAILVLFKARLRTS